MLRWLACISHFKKVDSVGSVTTALATKVFKKFKQTEKLKMSFLPGKFLKHKDLSMSAVIHIMSYGAQRS